MLGLRSRSCNVYGLESLGLRLRALGFRVRVQGVGSKVFRPNVWGFGLKLLVASARDGV